MPHISRSASSGKKRAALAVLFCMTCIAVNRAGSALCSAFSLPLYLDSGGTILAAIVGGYVPGVVVGYLTNILNGLIDHSSLYYSIINVLIALAAARMAHRNWFRSLPKTILSILVFAFIGGVAASLLTWCLYGFSFGDGATAALVESLYATGAFSPMAAQLCGDFAADAVDKTITVVVVVLAWRVLASKGAQSIDCGLWKQVPLTRKQRSRISREARGRASIRNRIFAMVSSVVIVVAAATTWISYTMFNTSMVEDQGNHALGVNKLALQAIDPERVDDYLERGEACEDFEATEQRLAEIRDSFPEVQYIYAYRILEDGCHVVLDPDTADEPGSDPGEVIPFDNAFLDYRDDLLAGREIPPIVSNETYGWLLTAYTPVTDRSGRCVCYVATDILMDHIVLDGIQFLTRITSLFLAFFVLVCTVGLWLAEYALILPLNSIAYTASRLDFSSDETRANTQRAVCALDIATGDEVENLYRAIATNVENTVHFINESEEKTRTIERMQSNLIMVMADLVESRDQYTGDHIRKTAAYVRLIMQQMRREGVYADQLTDEFIDNVNNSAPLHDIGKIVVSDTILNKPGRLTDEEFKIMQGHTTAGRQILESAEQAVSDPMYLEEAKRLAEFHHEKWNGTGYPAGLSGEDIPLSARIMAVADVFDALVSKRSYKDGFPLEKAFAIIEEGVGTHFDPLIASAFLHARDEAAAIARNHGDA